MTWLVRWRDPATGELRQEKVDTPRGCAELADDLRAVGARYVTVLEDTAPRYPRSDDRRA